MARKKEKNNKPKDGLSVDFFVPNQELFTLFWVAQRRQGNFSRHGGGRSFRVIAAAASREK